MSRVKLFWIQWDGKLWPTLERVKLTVSMNGGLFRYSATVRSHDYIGPLPEVTEDTKTKDIIVMVIASIMENQSPHGKEDADILTRYAHQNRTLWSEK